MMHELIGFTVPDWMLDKMKMLMQATRTDSDRPTRSALDNLASAYIGSQVGIFSHYHHHTPLDSCPKACLFYTASVVCLHVCCLHGSYRENPSKMSPPDSFWWNLSIPV